MFTARIASSGLEKLNTRFCIAADSVKPCWFSTGVFINIFSEVIEKDFLTLGINH